MVGGVQDTAEAVEEGAGLGRCDEDSLCEGVVSGATISKLTCAVPDSIFLWWHSCSSSSLCVGVRDRLALPSLIKTR